MTENEAIEELRIEFLGDSDRQREAKNLAIKTLEELRQYRAIGTVEECRAAMGKQKPRKMESPWCPCCGNYLTAKYIDQKYHCIYCGQKLDWSDEE